MFNLKIDKIMSNLLGIFFHPVKVFENLKENNTFSFLSLLIVLFIMLFSFLLNAPIREKASIFLLSSMNLPTDQIDNITLIMHKMRYLQIINSEILGFGMIIFSALVIYLFARLQKNKIQFKQIFQLFILISPITYLGDILNSLLIYVSGIENVTSQYDSLMFGINKFFSISSIGTTFYAFLSYINPFQIWFIFLLCIGLKVLMDIGYSKSIFISITFWIISVLIPTLSIYFSELARDRAASIL